MENESQQYRLDKTAFRAMTVEEADEHYGFWKDKSFTERLNAAFYLINTFYGTNPKTQIDKTVFAKRKHT